MIGPKFEVPSACRVQLVVTMKSKDRRYFAKVERHHNVLLPVEGIKTLAKELTVIIFAQLARRHLT